MPAERERLLGQRPVTVWLTGLAGLGEVVDRVRPRESVSWTTGTRVRPRRHRARARDQPRPRLRLGRSARGRPSRRRDRPNPQRRRSRRHRGARLPSRGGPPARPRDRRRDPVRGGPLRGAALRLRGPGRGRGLREGPAGRTGPLPRRHVALRGSGVPRAVAADPRDRDRRGHRPGGAGARSPGRLLAGASEDRTDASGPSLGRPTLRRGSEGGSAVLFDRIYRFGVRRTGAVGPFEVRRGGASGASSSSPRRAGPRLPSPGRGRAPPLPVG